MLYEVITLVIAFVLTTIITSGQCNEKNFAFQEGEVINYHAYYNWGFIWLNAGMVTFTVDKTQVDNKPAYYLKSHA